MKEVKALAALLVVLLAAAWLSYNQDKEPEGAKKVAILSASPGELTSLSFVTRTQTVSMSFRELKGERFAWFVVKTRSSTRAFTANDKIDKLFESYAPFKALRSLGKGLTDEDLKLAELTHPRRRLTVGLKSGERVFDLGGRTHGSRNHYLRPPGKHEVFLVEGRVIQDLEFPEGRFMQRKLRTIKLEDVASVTIAANGKVKKVLRKNRLSAKDAFWAEESAPDQRSETLGNYLDKIEKLSIINYGPGGEPLTLGEMVVEVSWLDEDGKALENLVLTRTEDDGKVTYIARSGASRLPGEVNRTTATQLERDLEVVFGD